MRYGHSSKSFRDYQSASGWWSKRAKRRPKKRVIHHYAEPIFKSTNPWKKVSREPSGHFIFRLLPFIIVLWAATLLFLPYFQIRNITYEGLKILKPTEIEDALRNKFLKSGIWWPRTNYFLVNEKTIAEYLRTIFSLQAIQVTKIFPNSLAISLEEKISALIYDSGTDYYLLDQQGTVIKYLMSNTTEYSTTSTASSSSTIFITPANNVSTTLFSSLSDTTQTHVPDFRKLTKEYGQYPILYNLHSSTTIKGQVLSENFVPALIRLHGQLERARLGTVYYFVLENPEAGVVVFTNHPWRLLMQPLNAHEEQINKIKLILKDNHPTNYIDVRFGDRVYWK